jgi:diguanylate cyclase (GGDEF)-like protein/PAS domain S-box-containing protein
LVSGIAGGIHLPEDLMRYRGSSYISGFGVCLQTMKCLLEIVNGLGAAIIIISREGKIRMINNQALALYKYSGEQMTGLEFAKLGAQIAPFKGDTVKKWLNTVMDKGQLSVDWLSRDKLERHFWVNISFSKIKYESQPMILALITDASKLKATQWELEICERKYKALIKAMPDVIFHVDNNTKILSCLASDNEKLIKPADQLVGMYFYDIMPHRLANEFLMNFMLVLANREPQVVEYALPLKGECTYHEARIVYLDHKEVMIICRDISERKRRECELRNMSYYDSLTGLYNRAFFENEVKRAISRACFPLALIVCDVDGLKIVNDNLGHETGDRLLKTAAETLKQAVPDNEILSRIGGDEFVVLLLNTRKEEVIEVCRRIQQRIAEFNQEVNSFHLSISFGYAISNGVTDSIKELFKEADDNMYKAKQSRSRVPAAL